MIYEELEAEVESLTNDLVIEYIAKLLVNDSSWDKFITQGCEKTARSTIMLYISHVTRYTVAKINFTKAKRQGNQFREDYGHYFDFVEAEKALQLATYNKNLFRAKLIAAGVDYKKYHKK